MNSALRALLLLALPLAAAGGTAPDEKPGGPGEWGFHPAGCEWSARNPPAMVWRPQKTAKSYELEIAKDQIFAKPDYAIASLPWNAHCPSRSLEPGTWFWRFRFVDSKGKTSEWSTVRSFRVDANSTAFPMPARADLLARIPTAHPRLLVRPEDLPRLRAEAAGARQPDFADLCKACERILKNPPPTAEPPKYPAGMERESDEWMKIWWGNREYTIAALDSAARLGFARLLGAPDNYAIKGREILMACAQWDPVGSTGFRYNDEAGMPYAYFFSRAYTFLHGGLSEADRAKCREVMTARGREMFRHLCPRQFWTPYESHANRGWHKLGEVAIAFLGEIPEAEDWLWFAVNKQFCTYPVWNDDDGGWHEGLSYWQSYLGRFSMWADVLRSAAGIDVYRLPYFAKIGYYPMYLTPPGTPGSGFGDLNADRPGDRSRELMYTFAGQAGNPHWEWYAEQLGKPGDTGGYIAYLRGSHPEVKPQPPTDLPSSRVWRGVGQAALNTDLTRAANNVSVLFKSSPFGTQSHGYDSQNAFMLYAFGERLLVSTGRRDQYGSAHHRDWMWETKSVNSVTVNGKGQLKHQSNAAGKIIAFHTSADLDYVAGEAAAAYGGALQRFTRHLIFVKPDLIVINDQLTAPSPATFEWHLHSPLAFERNSGGDVTVTGKQASCQISFLAPAALDIAITDRYDVPPRAKIKVKEWHLTAATPAPSDRMEFVTAIRPWRNGAEVPGRATLERTGSGWRIRAPTANGEAVVQGGGESLQVTLGGKTTVLPLAVDVTGQP